MIRVRKILNQKGSAYIGTIIALISVTGIGVVLVSSTLALSVNTHKSYQRISALALAEAGVEKTIWELNSGATPSCQTTCDFGEGQYEIAITDLDSETKELIATGYLPNKSSWKTKRSVKVILGANPNSEGVAFNYAIQSGPMGIDVSGSSEVKGTLYSNGNISASGSAQVKEPGDAWAVGSINDPGNRIKGTKTSGAPTVPLPTLNLDMWKNLAIAGGTTTGSYSPPSTGVFTNLGPQEYTGDFSMSGSSQKVNLTGPLYIHGNLTVSGGEWKLDDSFSTKSVLILVDGKINISGSSIFRGNSSGSYIMFVSTNNASDSGNPAISYAGSSTGEKLGLYAYNGSLKLSGSGKIIAGSGQGIFISGNGDIEYESGMASPEFSGGPGGSWTKKSWQEK